MHANLKALLASIALIGVSLLMQGCTSTNLADVVGQLSKDSATSCFDIQIATPWGSQKATYARSNSANNSAASDTNGCAFQHGGAPAVSSGTAGGSGMPAPVLPAAPAAPAVKSSPLSGQGGGAGTMSLNRTDVPPAIAAQAAAAKQQMLVAVQAKSQ